jgi:hypothetical protein
MLFALNRNKVLKIHEIGTEYCFKSKLQVTVYPILSEGNQLSR